MRFEVEVILFHLLIYAPLFISVYIAIQALLKLVIKLPLFFGILFSIFNYSLLFYAIATISHTNDYSQYGKLFSRFYSNILLYFDLMSAVIFIIIWLWIWKNNCLKIKPYFYQFIYGVQLGLLFFIIFPDIWLANILNIFGITDMALKVFANVQNINNLDITFKQDLITIKYSLKSKIAIFEQLFFNAVGIALPMIIKKLVIYNNPELKNE